MMGSRFRWVSSFSFPSCVGWFQRVHTSLWVMLIHASIRQRSFMGTHFSLRAFALEFQSELVQRSLISKLFSPLPFSSRSSDRFRKHSNPRSGFGFTLGSCVRDSGR